MEISRKVINGFFHELGKKPHNEPFRIIQDMGFEFKVGEEFEMEEAPEGDFGLRTFKVKSIEKKLTINSSLHIHYFLEPISDFRVTKNPLHFELKSL